MDRPVSLAAQTRFTGRHHKAVLPHPALDQLADVLRRRAVAELRRGVGDRVQPCGRRVAQLEREVLGPAARVAHRGRGEVAAALLGSDERLEYTLVGDTVNLAQRLQQLASAGETVLSEPTWRSVTLQLDADALPTQLVKGRETPVAAYKLGAAEVQEAATWKQ